MKYYQRFSISINYMVQKISPGETHHCILYRVIKLRRSCPKETCITYYLSRNIQSNVIELFKTLNMAAVIRLLQLLWKCNTVGPRATQFLISWGLSYPKMPRNLTFFLDWLRYFYFHVRVTGGQSLLVSSGQLRGLRGREEWQRDMVMTSQHRARATNIITGDMGHSVTTWHISIYFLIVVTGWGGRGLDHREDQTLWLLHILKLWIFLGHPLSWEYVYIYLVCCRGLHISQN